MVALKKGFNEIVPPLFMEMFDERETELIVCGLGEVDVSDWRMHTEYRNCSPEDDLVIMASLCVCVHMCAWWLCMTFEHLCFVLSTRV